MKAPEGIRIIDDLIEGTSEIMEFLQQTDGWRRSSVSSDRVISDVRTSDTLYIPMLSWQNPPLIHDMNRKVWQALDEYAKDYHFGFSSIQDVSIQRYEGDQHYEQHMDAGPDMPRIVSAVLYLNTVKKGGETRFTLFDYSVKPIAGRLAIFPSNYIYRHEALPPKKGIKIAAAYWALA